MVDCTGLENQHRRKSIESSNLSPSAIGILGDSNGCGEWSKDGHVVHKGLQYYLEQVNYRVFNFSTPACDSQNILYQAKANKKILKKCKYVFVFVTDISRGIDFQKFWLTRKTVEYYKDRNLKRIEKFINQLDAVKLHNLVILGAQSPIDPKIVSKKKFVKFAFNIFELLFANINGYEMHFAQHLNTIPQDINKDVIDYIWQQHQIWEQYQNSDFLQPDRHHPNRHAHKIIFDALVNKYNL